MQWLDIRVTGPDAVNFALTCGRSCFMIVYHDDLHLGSKAHAKTVGTILVIIAVSKAPVCSINKESSKRGSTWNLSK